MKSPQPVVRCGIYTRKSTEEGLEQEFNSLMAQREAAEAYILSQREQGWSAIPEHYDDGGFSGGNMDRPALKRLVADVEAKRVDCVVVYKVDRLSRSLLDFATIIGVLDKHHATFVSVTQQFNTNTSLGRLTLNVLLSFAQFEREIISERTRDKVCAARRKGKWTGGHPMLGYDVAAGGGKLHVNEAEGRQVREIFSIFNRQKKLIETLDEVDGKGWRTKSWMTRIGTNYGGSRFNRHTLAYLLSNPIYIGKVRLKGELHDGEHTAIVDPKVWQRTSALLAANRQTKPGGDEKPQRALLRGLLFCQACQMPMVPTYTKRNKTKVRYYTCRTAQNRGWKSCPAKTLPAREIEEAVLARLPEAGAKRVDALRGLVERIAYDGLTRQVSVTLREG